MDIMEPTIQRRNMMPTTRKATRATPPRRNEPREGSYRALFAEIKAETKALPKSERADAWYLIASYNNPRTASQIKYALSSGLLHVDDIDEYEMVAHRDSAAGTSTLHAKWIG